jgi:endonuclease VIII
VPEGDTIFRSARALGKALTGERVVRFETQLAHLASVNDDTPVEGRTVDQVEARGKWLLMHFSGDLILTTHMLMSGSWHIYRAGERWRMPRASMRCAIYTVGWQAVAFNVPVAKFFTARTLERNSAVPKLGPDLLGDTFSGDEARARVLARPEEEIANVLLNQRVIAGIGNVYKCEVCFLCGVHPFRHVSTLTADELDCMLHEARKLLQVNVQHGAEDGIVTYTGKRRTTGRSDTGARLWVYARQGQPCRRCGTPVLHRKQGPDARSTYWCPECQPTDKPVAGWAMQSVGGRRGGKCG